MGITHNQAKQKWNADHYTQVKVSVPQELAAVFKDRCFADGVSIKEPREKRRRVLESANAPIADSSAVSAKRKFRASEITSFMRQKTETGGIKKTVQDPYGTRQKRRKALAILNVQLTDILDAEQRYLDNIPYNLQSSHFYSEAELTVSALEEALNIISEAY